MSNNTPNYAKNDSDERKHDVVIIKTPHYARNIITIAVFVILAAILGHVYETANANNAYVNSVVSHAASVVAMNGGNGSVDAVRPMKRELESRGFTVKHAACTPERAKVGETVQCLFTGTTPQLHMPISHSESRESMTDGWGTGTQ